MWCCDVAHFRGLPPLHRPIMALHCSILSPIVQFVVFHIGLISSVLQDGMLVSKLICVSVYSAAFCVSNLQTFFCLI
jgi:hypothetical protein